MHSAEFVHFALLFVKIDRDLQINPDNLVETNLAANSNRADEQELIPTRKMAIQSSYPRSEERSASQAPFHQEGNMAGLILLGLCFSHLLNDTIQSLIPAIYPVLKTTFRLDFGQIGLITLTFQLTSSLLQPLVGTYTDHKPKPFSLAIGMGVSLCGLLLLSRAWDYTIVLLAAGLVGVGSSIFHPEATRLARFSSGGRHGFAQSVFQLGGYMGTAIGPALAAIIVVPAGQHSIAWFSIIALIAIIVLSRLGFWYKKVRTSQQKKSTQSLSRPPLPGWKVFAIISILAALIFSKYFYLASISSYYTFYLIDRFHLSIQSSQMLLFLFLFAVAIGTIIGGPIGDRYGRKLVIWFSILGVTPFTIMLPYADLFWTCVLSVIIGLILASAFSAIIVYAQELVPGKVGMIGGVFYGLAFGMGGLGSAVLGKLADLTSINFVYHVCSFLPLLGLLTVFLPNLDRWVANRGR
jgi:MFS transporter, FSR family, fosmidomycin resistance protein